MEIHCLEILRGIPDSNFSIAGEKTIRYHFECQSTEDGSLTLRLFEYGAQIALTMADYSKEESTFIFPHAAVLYLRTEKQVAMFRASKYAKEFHLV